MTDASLKSVLEGYFLPDRPLDEDEARRLRTIALLSAILPSFAIFFAVLVAQTSQFGLVSGTLLSGALLGWVNLVVVKRGTTRQAGVVIIVAALIAITPSPWVSGSSGIFDASQLWSVVTPMLALYAAGLRMAIVAGLVHTTNLVLLYALRNDPNVVANDHGWALFHLLGLLTAGLALVVIGVAFDRTRRDAAARLTAMIKGAEARSEELEAFNVELRVAREQAGEEAARNKQLLEALRSSQSEQGNALDVSASELSGFVETQHAVVKRAREARMTTTKSARTINDAAEVSEKTATEVEVLVENIREATTKLYEVVRGGQEVERNVKELSGYAETSRSAMEGMRAKIEHVEQNATAAEQLAERVIGASRRGQEAVGRATLGMDAIRRSSRDAGETIRRLGDRIENIDEILAVIQDVADETQLLSLNASIIAAQAGAFGRPFSVVADEIKKLAQRTSKSTEEIGHIIETVQDGSRAAISVIDDGERFIQDGLTRSRQAELALEEIVEASAETTTVVKNIAALTVDQAMQANHVAKLANQVAGNATQIADVTEMHVSRVNEIESIAGALASSSTTLQRTAEVTRESSQKVAEDTREVEMSMEHIHVAQEEQTRAVERILSAIDAIRVAQRAQVEAALAATANHSGDESK